MWETIYKELMQPLLEGPLSPHVVPSLCKSLEAALAPELQELIEQRDLEACRAAIKQREERKEIGIMVKTARFLDALWSDILLGFAATTCVPSAWELESCLATLRKSVGLCEQHSACIQGLALIRHMQKDHKSKAQKAALLREFQKDFHANDVPISPAMQSWLSAVKNAEE